MANRESKVMRAIIGALVGAALAVGWQCCAAGSAEAAGKQAVLEVQTVPALPGARLSVDGKAYRADSRGLLRLKVPRNSKNHRLGVSTGRVERGDAQYTFVRWWRQGRHGQDFLPALTGVNVRQHVRVLVAYRVTRVLRYSFVDEAKNAVERQRVTRVEFRSDHGQTVVGNGSGRLRLLTDRPDLVAGTVVAKQLRYSVQRVDIDGSNVVQVNRQVFVPSTDSTVQVPILLRTAHFSTRDLLFGQPVGTRLHLTFPSGEVRTVDLDVAGKATVTSLARGNYSVWVDAAGYAFPRPLALSRNQYVDLPVLTYLDTVVVIGALLLLLMSLYLIRVRHRLVTLTRRLRS